MTKLNRATRILSRVETYLLRNCFIFNDNTLLMKQNVVLSDVLRKLLGFLQKYSKAHPNDQLRDKNSTRKTLNEVVLLINSLALALEGSMCAQNLRNSSNIEAIAHQEITLREDDRTVVLEESEPMALYKNCRCKKSFCEDMSCPKACKNVCWFKYNLGRFGCQAVDESTSVSLDVLCDGKLDCYDETDEAHCNTGKYSRQASNKL
jgi:hypothetical protein